MEAGKQTEIARTAQELSQSEVLRKMVEQIDLHILTGAPEYMYVATEADLRLLCRLTGLDAIEGAQVLGYEYAATATEPMGVYGDSFDFEGTASVEQILSRLGDFGTNLEFPNNYSVKLAVALDSQTMVRFEHALNESPVLCDDCAQSDDMMIHYNFESGHGCEHAEDLLVVTNFVSIHPRVEGLELFPPS